MHSMRGEGLMDLQALYFDTNNSDSDPLSHDFPAREKKYQEVSFEQYITHTSEPHDNIFRFIPVEHEARLLKDSHNLNDMRQNFRRLAGWIRNNNR